MEDNLHESFSGEFRPLVRFVRFWLLVILVTNILALVAAGFVLSKLGEFWAIDSRNIYHRLERLEEYHPK